MKTATKAEMRQEAANRMSYLNLSPLIIKEFQDEEKVYLSFNGLLYYPTGKQIERIKLFEDESQCLVYHIIQNFTNIGQMLSFLYVSNYPEEWGMDKMDLKRMTPYAYVANIDDEICSEFGRIKIQNYISGLNRVF